MFGGCFGENCSLVSNETWVEANGSWTELRPSAAPSPRFGALMAWDPADGYVLLFGGVHGGVALNDTWAYKNESWNPVLPSGPSPPPAQSGALAYDPSDHAMVLYGGIGCTAACATWTYSGGTWTALELSPHPAYRFQEGLAEDLSDDGALLYGGLNATGGSLFDTWLFSHDTWKEENVTSAEPRLYGGDMAWDPDLYAVVLYGGNLSANDTGTWEFQYGNWTSWSGNPSVQSYHWSSSAFVWDPTTADLLLPLSGCLPVTCPVAALWGFGPQNAVGVVAHGVACGNFIIGGTTLGSPGNVSLENGTYPLQITACPGDLLGNVTAGPALHLDAAAQNLTEWTGSLLVEGAGTLDANFTHVASNPPPTGLAAISVLGLTFLELILVVVAVVAGLVALLVLSRRPGRPPARKAPSSSRAPPGF